MGREEGDGESVNRLAVGGVGREEGIQKTEVNHGNHGRHGREGRKKLEYRSAVVLRRMVLSGRLACYIVGAGCQETRISGIFTLGSIAWTIVFKRARRGLYRAVRCLL